MTAVNRFGCNFCPRTVLEPGEVHGFRWLDENHTKLKECAPDHALMHLCVSCMVAIRGAENSQEDPPSETEEPDEAKRKTALRGVLDWRARRAGGLLAHSRHTAGTYRIVGLRGRPIWHASYEHAGLYSGTFRGCMAACEKLEQIPDECPKT